jgi:hypothetical protein
MIAHRVTHPAQHHGATPNQSRKAHVKDMIKLGYVALNPDPTPQPGLLLTFLQVRQLRPVWNI